MKRLHRCHACGWRGWGTETLAPADLGDVREPNAPPPDLHAIDRGLASAPPEPDKKPGS
jgi:hypothetical protein